MIDVTKAFVKSKGKEVDVVTTQTTGSSSGSCSYVTIEEFLNFIATDETQQDMSLNLSVEEDTQSSN